MTQYAGQQLDNGVQSETYANHFIGIHLQEVASGQTYSQMSAKAQANPSDQRLAAQVNTLFKGETLRGLQLLVQCTPLYHGVALERALTTGAVGFGALVHVVYLVALGVAGLAVASRRLELLLLP